MKLASLVNLKPLKEGSMQARELADYNSLEELQAMYDQLMRDMEQEAEPEGGPIADQYADQMQDIEDAMQIKSPFEKDSVGGMTYDQAIGRVSKDQFTKSSKFDRMNEATEKSWNAVDVSRKAEKEVDNKEWNSRTTKKLDMLIALNKAGKFKKDWGEEKLQGWVDQNYSWEKLSRQFKSIKEMKNNKQKNLLIERFQELAGIKPLGETMQQGDYSAIEQGWDGLPWDEQRDIINTALSGEARPDDFEKDFDQLKSEIPDFESGVANYLGIDEGESNWDKSMGQVNNDISKNFYDDEDMDDPDEDLVIIGSGYLDIKSNFGERPSQTNGEYAEIGQKVVDQLHNGDKDAALDFIYSKINEVDEGTDAISTARSLPGRNDNTSTLVVTSEHGVEVHITDPRDIQDFLSGDGIVYGEDQDGGAVEVSMNSALDHKMTEGSCGYSQEAPGGEELDTPGGTKGMPADTRTMTMMRETIRKEIKKLHENK
jgi:hypothetical protein